MDKAIPVVFLSLLVQLTFRRQKGRCDVQGQMILLHYLGTEMQCSVPAASSDASVLSRYANQMSHEISSLNSACSLGSFI